MKKAYIVLVAMLMIATSCNNDDSNNNSEQPTLYNIQLRFTHNWEGTSITSTDFNTTQFTNGNGDQLSIERLRYLISRVTLTDSNGEPTVFNGYNLVDLTTESNLIFSPSESVAPGDYNLSFTFGFNNEDNVDGIYADLNSATFNVPQTLGGGYHYMQLDGKYVDTATLEASYNYHAIRAVDNPGPNPTFPQDTFFVVDLGTITINNDLTAEVRVDLSEWFENPNLWDLNIYNTNLMSNSAAQIMMYENGQNVFSLGALIQ